MTPDPASSLLVVARFLDGNVLKGTTRDFSPHRPEFHLHPQGDARGAALKIAVADLKAVFFVRSLEGHSEHAEPHRFLGNPAQGRRVLVTFQDGEVIAGSTVGYAPNRPGFFLVPGDPESNNLRAFVVASSVSKVEFVPFATGAGPGPNR